MTEPPHLDAYQFHENEYESYDALLEEFEWEVPKKFNMASYLCDRWAEEERGSALFFEDEAGETKTYTFSELRETANRLANYLETEGVTRGDRVGVNAPQKPVTLLTHLACWKLGAVSIPLSTLFGPDALTYRLDDSEAVACVVAGSNVEAFREAREELPAIETVLTVDCEASSEERDLWEVIENQSSEFETVETDAEDDAIIIYTSGTTGEPKGVRHAHRVILGHLPLFVTTFCNMEIDDEDVFWTPAEWAWVASLFDVLFPALYYGQPVLAYDSGPFSPEKAFSLIERYEVTSLFAPATALRMMMQVESPEEHHQLDSIRVIASGGESLGQSIVEWAEQTFDGAAVHEGYGQTEANVIVGDCTALMEFHEGTMGRAGPGHEIAILDPGSSEGVETGEIGEISVRYEGDLVCMKEYLNKPEKTARKVRDGWLRTEDLGSMDSDGYISFKSRADDVIISAGYRIGPEEVEDHLATHEAVADAAVIGVPDEERGEVPKAFVVLADGAVSDGLEAELQRFVKERLAAYEYPREVTVVDELPKTATGKIRRESLREREGI
jgi:acetyl-CoA synthetase